MKNTNINYKLNRNIRRISIPISKIIEILNISIDIKIIKIQNINNNKRTEY